MMLRILTGIVALSVAMPAQATVQYDCVIDSFEGTNEQDGKFATTQLNFPGMPNDAWNYQFSLEPSRKDLTLTVQSQVDPAGLSGKYTALQLRSGVISAMAVRGGSCMFSEKLCIDLIQLIDTSATTAVLTITPSAFGSTKTEFAEYLHVTLRGRCTRSEVKS